MKQSPEKYVVIWNRPIDYIVIIENKYPHNILFKKDSIPFSLTLG